MANDIAVAPGDPGDPQWRTVEVAPGKHIFVMVVGAHIRTYDGHQSLVLSGSSQALTVPAGATHADIYCEGVDSTSLARYWEDGTAPTASSGFRLMDHEILETAAPAGFRSMNGNGNCTLRVAFYHYA